MFGSTDLEVSMNASRVFVWDKRYGYSGLLPYIIYPALYIVAVKM